MRLQEVESQELPGRGNGHCFGIALAPPACRWLRGQDGITKPMRLQEVESRGEWLGAPTRLRQRELGRCGDRTLFYDGHRDRVDKKIAQYGDMTFRPCIECS